MEERLRAVLTCFAKNDAEMTDQFLGDRSLFPHLGAYLLSAFGAETEQGRLAAARELARSFDGRFDGLSEQLQPLLSAVAAASAEGEAALLSAAAIYDALRRELFPSPHLVAAACVLQLLGKTPADTASAVEEASALHRALAAADPLRTGGEDLPLCLLAALSGIAPEEAAGRISRCEERLRTRYRKTNSTQALAQVLALYDDCDAACGRALETAAALRALGMRLGASWPLVSLGVLAGTREEPALIALRVRELRKTLRRMRGLGTFRASDRERLTLACLLAGLSGEETEERAVVSAAALLVVIAAHAVNTLAGLGNPGM